MEECRSVAINMARKSQKAMNLAIDLLGEYSDKTADRVEKLENQIDQYEDALGTYLVKLSGRELSIKDSRVLSVLLHCIGDFERISDHAVNIRDAAVEMHKKDLKFSEKAKQELRVFSNAIRDILDRAGMAFETGDVELAKEIKKKSKDISTGFALEHVRLNLDLFCRIFPQTLNVLLTIVPILQYACYRLTRVGLTPMNILIY